MSDSLERALNECEDKIGAALLWLDDLGPELAFERVQELVNAFSWTEYRMWLWDVCLDKLSLTQVSFNTQLFKFKVEYSLSTRRDVIDSLEELANAYIDRPNELLMLSGVRLKLADETARRAYAEGLQEAEDYLKWTKENLWLLAEYIGKQHEPQEDLKRRVQQAKRAVKDARSSLDEVNYDNFRRSEITRALDWALRAQKLRADNVSSRELIAEMKNELGLSVGPYVPDAQIVVEIRELVGKNRLVEALEKLCDIEAYQHRATLLSQRLTRIHDEERQGTITPGDARTERTTIADAILDLIRRREQ